MLWAISVVLIILWILGLGTGFTMGSSIHILFAAAVALLVVSISQEAMINEKLRRVLRSHSPNPDQRKSTCNQSFHYKRTERINQTYKE
jgi:hypothetical protein